MTNSSSQEMGIQYRPLKESRQEIRLLIVHRAENLEDPLYGTIRHAKLSTAVYSALSYVWGQKDYDRANITIDYDAGTLQNISNKLSRKSRPTTYVHSIGSSLARALRHLRHTYGGIVIWTDALCINQKDDKEKSWQVLLMTQIYINATEVQAWLGPSFDDQMSLISNINGAFELANTVWSLAEHIQDTQDIVFESNWLQACFTVASSQNSINQDQSGWSRFATRLRHAALSNPSILDGLRTLKVLSQNTYFSRMWILQEAGRAGQLTFHYGLKLISHRRLLLALSLASSLRSSKEASMLTDQLNGFDGRFLSCLSARTTCTQGRSLRDVLVEAYYSLPPLHGATDERDLIYARLGLSNNPSAIKCDYKLSVADVFTNATRFLLLQGFMDTLITFKPYRHQQWQSNEYIPSWAYNWPKKGLHSFDKFSAAGDTTPRASVVNACDAKYKHVLTMSGFGIGAVSIVSDRFSAVALASGLHRGTVADANLRAAMEHPSDEKKRTITQKIILAYQKLNMEISEDDIQALFRYRSLAFASFWCWWIQWIAILITMIEDAQVQCLENAAKANVDIIGEERTLDLNIAELLFREAPQSRTLSDTANLKQFGRRNGLLILADYQRWANLLRSSNDAQYGSENLVAVAFADSLFRSAWGMRAAVLKSGRLAYLPEDTKPQDEIVIFYGVKAPLVIRSVTDDMYRIIGPAHVCGVMHGELMGSWQPSYAYQLV